MRKTLTLPLAALALLASGTVLAQVQESAPQRGAEMTRATAEERAASMFARLDVNSDGEISDADKQARADTRFDRMDTDGNGSIDRAEFAAISEQRNASREERMAAREERRGARQGAGAREGRNFERRNFESQSRRGGGRRGNRGMGNGRQIMATADADNNGTITQAEFTNAMLTRFDAADANNDGTVSREERRNARPEGSRGRHRNIG